MFVLLRFLNSKQYAAAAWDPHLVKDIKKLEAVQRRAARFVANNTSRIPGYMTKPLMISTGAP